MNINSRFKEIINTCYNGNKRAFSIAVGLSTSVVENVVGKRNGNPSYEVLEKICANANINPEWLLTGKGNMLKSDEEPTRITSELRSPKSTRGAGTPLYDVSASAGYGSFDEMINREKLVGNFVIPGFTNIDWMIYVAGASMYPKYSSGDIIACRVLHESRFIQWGKVYVLATREQGILVKRLKKCQDENYLTAVCDNPSYDSFDVPKDEILGIALVVGVIRLE